MNPKNNYKYTITDRLGTYVSVPLGENDFSIEWERQDDDNLDYSKGIQGKMYFQKESYLRLMQMENSVYRCEEQILTVYRNCGGVDLKLIEARISLNEGDFDLDKCYIVLKSLKDSENKCYDDNKGEKINLLSLIYDRITVQTKSFVGTLQTKNCFTNSPSYQSPDYWCGDGDPYAQNWTLLSYNGSSPDGVRNSFSNTWVREIVEIDCSETPDANWILVEDNCGTTGKRKYAQGVTLINCQSSSTPEDENGAYQYSLKCQVLGYEGTATIIDNGVSFTKVMIELLRNACPNLILKSDFFQINPDNISSTNYVTNKPSMVDNIVIFQKSDVKRPNVSGNASKMEISLEKMLETLKIMFNVKWRVDGNVFRLEHISYYSKTVGFDITIAQLIRFFKGKRKYSYASEKIPQKEIFAFKERSSNPDWNVEVEYSGCVKNKKNNIVDYTVDEGMTDIVYALANPDKDSNKVDDLGFVLVSTKKIGTDYFINSEESPNGRVLNNVFAMRQLFRDYHYYERPMKSGKVNGTQTDFVSTIPTKKGDTFSIPYCPCNNNFNPDNFIITPLGQGIVSGATYKFKDEMLELDLLYESNQDLTPNSAPTLAGAGVYTTYENIPKQIPIVAQDVDGFITGITVYNLNPAYGSVTIAPDYSYIIFTPASGFQGFVTFQLRAFDNYSEPSNFANFGITVQPPNLPPVAGNDSYNAWHGQTYTMALGIFANDSDDYGFISIVNPNLTTSQGVPITIQANGKFNYTPPSGFEGVDSFVYTIQDDLGQTSSGTVSITVGYYDQPIAVGDSYLTKINTQLITDNSLGKRKLTFNDYTPNGVTYTYTCTAETKATALGGTVQILSDGNFIYTPPSGIVNQQDSFTYTVSNGIRSNIGTAVINIIPQIYVKLVTSDPQIQIHTGEPSWIRTQDYSVYFYSDAGGTVPFNVSGLNFRVKINENHSGNNPSGSFNYNNSWLTDILSGTSTKILDDFAWAMQYNDSDYGTSNENTTVTILSDNTYTVI